MNGVSVIPFGVQHLSVEPVLLVEEELFASLGHSKVPASGVTLDLVNNVEKDWLDARGYVDYVDTARKG